MSAAVDWERAAKATMHPTQRAILEHLDRHGRGSASEVARATKAGSVPGVAYHVKELAAKRLIRKAGTRPVRGAVEHFYRIAP